MKTPFEAGKSYYNGRGERVDLHAYYEGQKHPWHASVHSKVGGVYLESYTDDGRIGKGRGSDLDLVPPKPIPPKWRVVKVDDYYDLRVSCGKTDASGRLILMNAHGVVFGVWKDWIDLGVDIPEQFRGEGEND